VGRSKIDPQDKKERKREGDKKYQRKNRKKLKAYKKKYYTSHKEELRAAYRTYQAMHKDEIKAYQLQRTYGISWEEYTDKLRESKGLCASCGRSFKDGRDTCLDHNHETGKVRGIICRRCNSWLGKYENIEFRNNIEKYLNQYR
jgi:hypothetical protein